MEKIKVIFRVFKKDGDVIALFPYESYNDTSVDLIMSYQHIGQHGGASYNHCIDTTRPAKPSEYANLAKELKNIGYDIEIIKRRNYSRATKRGA